MPDDPASELRDATRRRLAALSQTDDARMAEREAIAAAHRAGIRQREIVAITGYTREHVRRIVAEIRERDHDQKGGSESS